MSLDQAWRMAETQVRKMKQHLSFGVALDGPGYVAWWGFEDGGWKINTWSDGEDGRDPSPAQALILLTEELRKYAATEVAYT